MRKKEFLTLKVIRYKFKGLDISLIDHFIEIGDNEVVHDDFFKSQSQDIIINIFSQINSTVENETVIDQNYKVKAKSDVSSVNLQNLNCHHFMVI